MKSEKANVIANTHVLVARCLPLDWRWVRRDRHVLIFNTHPPLLRETLYREARQGVRNLRCSSIDKPRQG